MMKAIGHNLMPAHGRKSILRWACLGGAILALGAIILIGSMLLWGGSTPVAAAAQPVTMPNLPTITYTLALPLVVNHQQLWDPRDMIAFEREMPNGTNRAGMVHDIFLMKADGSQVENLTDHPADDGAPAWSPDGNWIAFSSDRVDADPENKPVYRAIFKIDLRTHEVVQLTDGTHDDRWPTWSPDGTRIAFMRKTPNVTNNDIWVMNADGSEESNLTYTSDYPYANEFPAWSRDGAWIVFSTERNWGGRDLWLIRPDGSDLHIVLRTDFGDPPEEYPNEEIYPSWGADGRIYYTFIPVKGDELLYRIWPDGSGREQVFADSYNRYIASWSPDGQCFVFYSYLGGNNKEVWKWCQGMGAAINLTNNALGDDEYCAWSPVP